MKEILQRLVGAGGRSASEAAQPRLTLAAFGKHPGWDDHLPGIGVDTETLARVKQVLYVSGIGGQIDSGVWEKLDAEKRQEGFDHTFLWLSPGHVVLGNMWSSTDRKGRSKYPMVVCVDGEAVTAGFLTVKAKADLEGLREACKASTSSTQVTAEWDAAQKRLRARLRDPAHPSTGPWPSIEARRRFLERREFGPERLGLLRVLHELTSAAGPSAAGHGSRPATIVGGRSHHFRAPLGCESGNEAFLLWTAFLECILSRTVPLWLIARGGVNWLDVLIGEPASDYFFCLQASPKALPLATEIPYELSPDLKARLQELEAKFLFMDTSKTARSETSLGRRAAVPSGRTASEAGKTGYPRRKEKRGVFIGVGALLLIAAAASVWWFSGSHSSISDSEPGAQNPTNDPQRQLILARSAQEKKYQSALKEALAAFDGKDYARAIAQANAALGIKPNDPAATRLRDEAQRQMELVSAAKAQEQKYQSTLKEAQAALDGKDPARAIAQADAALGIKPNDPAATGLRDEAQRQLGLVNAAKAQEQKYQSALKEAQAALDGQDHARAIAQADAALGIKPSDPAATRLRDEAQRQLELVNAAKAQEQKYQSALKEAQTALDGKDHARAIAQANAALGIKPNDPAATLLRDEAQRQLEVKEQPAVTAQPTNTVAGQNRDDATKLDATLDTLEVWFHLKAPSPRILESKDKQAQPLPFGKIPPYRQDQIFDQLDKMEKRYLETGALTDQRKNRIEKLKERIRNWAN